jgi:hypothetical protein
MGVWKPNDKIGKAYPLKNVVELTGCRDLNHKKWAGS